MDELVGAVSQYCDTLRACSGEAAAANCESLTLQMAEAGCVRERVTLFDCFNDGAVCSDGNVERKDCSPQSSSLERCLGAKP